MWELGSDDGNCCSVLVILIWVILLCWVCFSSVGKDLMLWVLKIMFIYGVLCSMVLWFFCVR